MAALRLVLAVVPPCLLAPPCCAPRAPARPGPHGPRDAPPAAQHAACTAKCTAAAAAPPPQCLGVLLPRHAGALCPTRTPAGRAIWCFHVGVWAQAFSFLAFTMCRALRARRRHRGKPKLSSATLASSPASSASGSGPRAAAARHRAQRAPWAPGAAAGSNAAPSRLDSVGPFQLRAAHMRSGRAGPREVSMPLRHWSRA